MTSEEAIKTISKMLAVTDLTVRGNMTAKMVEACRMAIEALKAKPCTDAVSRQAVLDLINADWKYEGLESDVENLPPVTPQPKTGHWIFKEFDEETGISNSKWCSACNYPMAQVYDDYCAHCGAIMVEPQESEGE